MKFAPALNEQQLIRCIITDSDLILEVESKYFITQIGKDLFKTLKYFYDRDNPVTPIQTNILNEGNRLNDAITEELTKNLFEVEYKLEDFQFYYDSLKNDNFKKIQSEKIMKEMLKKSESKGGLDRKDIRDFAESIVTELDEIEYHDKVVFTYGEALEKYKKINIKRQKGEYFFRTGDPNLDKFLGEGFAPGYITTLFSATGIGKSMYALTLVNKQINRFMPNAYFSLELGFDTTMDRLISQRNDLSMDFVRSQETAQNMAGIIEKERKTLENNKYSRLIVEPSLSIDNLEYYVKRFRNEMKKDYLIVTIDLLTMMKDFMGSNKAEVYEDNMNRLHYLVRRYNFHLFGIVQANREADNTKITKFEDLHKLKPSLNNIKSSGAIGERSRIVLGAFREKHYAMTKFPNDPRTEMMDDILEISIMKQTSGPLTTLEYYFVGKTSSIFYKKMDEE